MDDALPDIDALIEEMSDHLDADLIFFAGSIEAPYDTFLQRMLRERSRKRPNVVLFLTTPGGSPDVAYAMARSLQLHYADGKVLMFVHTFCKSAGTLVTLGADGLIMSDEAQLGPLDVQVSKRDELGERISGLTPVQALMTLRREAFRSFEEYLVMIRVSSGLQITTMTAAQIAAKLTNGCFSPIYKQLDPMSLGEHQRAMVIAKSYGLRLDRGNLKSHALESLISGYPSHDFVIDRLEAQEELFHRVRRPYPSELMLGLLLENEADEACRQDETVLRFLSEEPGTPTVTTDCDEQSSGGIGQVPEETGGDGKEPAGQDGPDAASPKNAVAEVAPTQNGVAS